MRMPICRSAPVSIHASACKCGRSARPSRTAPGSSMSIHTPIPDVNELFIMISASPTQVHQRHSKACCIPNSWLLLISCFNKKTLIHQLACSSVDIPMCVDICMDVCADANAGMRTDMRTNVCTHMGTDVAYRHACRLESTHKCSSTKISVHAHVYARTHARASPGRFLEAHG